MTEPVERKVDETDNRDVTTTVLRLNDGSFVEVDPIELFRNAMENAGLDPLSIKITIDDLLEEIDSKLMG